MVGGHIAGVALPAVLQILQLGRNSCRLEVTSRKGTGELTLIGGDLADARVGVAVGEPAAFEILGWSDPEIAIAELDAEPAVVTMSTPMAWLLVEAVRRQDEQSAEGNDTSDQSAATIAEPNSTDERLRMVLESVAEAIGRTGARSAALFDVDHGVALVDVGADDGGTERVARTASLLRAQMDLLGSLGLVHDLEDVTFTLEDAVHFLRPLPQLLPGRCLALDLSFARDSASQALIRRRLQQVEQEIVQQIVASGAGFKPAVA